MPDDGVLYLANMLDLISLRTPRSVKPGNLHHATAQCNSYAFFCVHLYACTVDGFGLIQPIYGLFFLQDASLFVCTGL